MPSKLKDWKGTGITMNFVREKFVARMQKEEL
jgi:hypothetical protein